MQLQKRLETITCGHMLVGICVHLEMQIQLWYPTTGTVVGGQNVPLKQNEQILLYQNRVLIRRRQ